MNKKLFLFVFVGFCSSVYAEPDTLLSVTKSEDTNTVSQRQASSQEKQPPSSSNGENNNGGTKALSQIETDKESREINSFWEKQSAIDFPNTYRFLEFGLEYPINFGIHFRYLITKSIYSRVGLSFMPGLFLDSFKSLSPSFGYLNEEEANLISKTFENSMYIDLRLAWAPYMKESIDGGGPYLELGLSGMFFGNGKLKGSDLSEIITNNPIEKSKGYSVKTNAYNTTIHIGYQIPFERVKLNIELGLIKILGAHILDKEALDTELLSAEQKQDFKEFLWNKGWIFPTFSAWVSFRF